MKIKAMDTPLEQITDEWIRGGNYSEFTVRELRDRLRTAIKRLEILENLREQVAKQAKEDNEGRAKVNIHKAARLAFIAQNLEDVA